MQNFPGFPKQLIDFFNNLKSNNSKQWFEEHKNDYETFVKGPACDFVDAVYPRLSKIVPKIIAIPKVNKSLFRLNRDVRFSKNKNPYKTNMGIWFWEGPGKRMECPGFYFHYENNQLLLATGFYIFTKELLAHYREQVVKKEPGKQLLDAMQKVSQQGYTINEKHYKKIPRGYSETDHNSELLYYNSMGALIEIDLPEDFFSEKIIDFTMAHFEAMLPLHQALVKIFN